MNDRVQNIAENLKFSLEYDTELSRKNLVRFADNFATKGKLRYGAVALNSLYATLVKDEHKVRIREEMIALVNEVVLNYKEDKLKSLQRRRQKKQLGQLYSSLPLPDQLIFSCRNLGLSFPKNGFSLENINLDLKLGEITGVVGENGNGKTTLFRLMVGENSPEVGQMYFPFLHPSQDEKLDWFNIRKQIAYVPQELSRWYGSLISNIHYEAAIHGIKGSENFTEVKFIIHRLGLEEHLNKKWKELSGGYKLRFALARALVWKPKLLIIDEPLANLDVKTQEIILRDLQELSRSLRYPVSIIISSQHLHEIESISDKILFLKRGRQIFYGAPKALGEARTGNIFELDCNLDIESLRAILQSINKARVYHNGMFYVVSTPVEMDSKEILKALLQNSVKIKYFRDISTSVKQLFT